MRLLLAEFNTKEHGWVSLSRMDGVYVLQTDARSQAYKSTIAVLRQIRSMIWSMLSKTTKKYRDVELGRRQPEESGVSL